MIEKPPLPPFQSVLDEQRGTVMAFLVAMVGPADADDCFQETFLAALGAYPQLSDARNLRGWVLTIAHRKAIDSLRATARRPAPRADLPERGYADAGLAQAENGLGEAWQAVAGLPPQQRAAVAHRFLADLRYREIGTILGCSEAAARRSVHDGLARIREEMAR